NSVSLTDLNQAEDTSPARFFAPSGPANHRINVAGKRKGRTMNPLTQRKSTTILPLFVALAFACFALSPQARAVCQQGCDLTTGTHNIDIGNSGVAGEANTIRIGRQGTQTATFIAGISGATVPTGVPVITDTDGHLGTTTSSARYKEAIKPMDNASEAILALK